MLHDVHSRLFRVLLVLLVPHILSMNLIRVDIETSEDAATLNKKFTITCKIHFIIKKAQVTHFYMYKEDKPDIKYPLNNTHDKKTGRPIPEKELITSIIFNKFKVEDKAKYICFARVNYLELNNSKIINYYSKPTILKHLKDKYMLFFNENFYIKTKVYGYPKPTAEWLYNNKTLPTHGPATFSVKGDQYILHGSFLIFDILLQGNFSVTISNKYGSFVKHFQIVLHERYPKLLKNKIIKKSYRSVLIEVIVPKFTHIIPPNVINIDAGSRTMQFDFVHYKKRNELLIDGLQPGKTVNIIPSLLHNRNGTLLGYAFKCFKCMLNVTLPAPKKPKPMVIISNKFGQDNDSYHLKWEPIANEGEPITDIQIRIRMCSVSVDDGVTTVKEYLEETWQYYNFTGEIYENTTEMIIYDLMGKTYYDLKATSENKIGISETNDNFIFSTKRDKYDKKPIENKLKKEFENIKKKIKIYVKKNYILLLSSTGGVVGVLIIIVVATTCRSREKIVEESFQESFQEPFSDLL